MKTSSAPKVLNWKIVVRMLVLVALLCIVLFAAAGTLAWPISWVYVVITVVMTAGSRLLLLRRSPDLVAELPGYAEYARQTRYRLVPGMW